MTLSFVFLAYSAYVVPMQLSFWAGRGACEPFPTLSFDLVVDTYFVVRPGPRPWSALLWARGRKDQRGGSGPRLCRCRSRDRQTEGRVLRGS